MADSAQTDIIVDDANAGLVSFTPTAAWTGSAGADLYKDAFQGGTYHYTYTAGASVSFTFVGSYVAYYADLNTDHGAFVASLDGGPATHGSSRAAAWSGAPRLLFASYVAPGRHTLAIANAENATAAGVDFFVYRAQGTPAAGEPPTFVYTGAGDALPYTPFTPPASTPSSTPSSTPTPPATPSFTPSKPSAIVPSNTSPPPADTTGIDSLLPDTNTDTGAATARAQGLTGTMALAACALWALRVGRRW